MSVQVGTVLLFIFFVANEGVRDEDDEINGTSLFHMFANRASNRISVSSGAGKLTLTIASSIIFLCCCVFLSLQLRGRDEDRAASGAASIDPLSNAQSRYQRKDGPDIYLAAAKSNGRALEFIPKGKRSREVCVAALSNDGPNSYKHVPAELWEDEDMCVTGVKCEPSVLRFVPARYKSKRLCELAFEKRPDCDMLEHIPEEFFHDRDFCLKAATSGDARFLDQYVPKNCLDQEMYNATVSGNSSLLDHVPEKYRTKELYMAMVRGPTDLERAYNKVPEHFRDREICLAAMHHYKLKEGTDCDALARTRVYNEILCKFPADVKKSLEDEGIFPERPRKQ